MKLLKKLESLGLDVEKVASLGGLEKFLVRHPDNCLNHVALEKFNGRWSKALLDDCEKLPFDALEIFNALGAA